MCSFAYHVWSGLHANFKLLEMQLRAARTNLMLYLLQLNEELLTLCREEQRIYYTVLSRHQ